MIQILLTWIVIIICGTSLAFVDNRKHKKQLQKQYSQKFGERIVVVNKKSNLEYRNGSRATNQHIIDNDNNG